MTTGQFSPSADASRSDGPRLRRRAAPDVLGVTHRAATQNVERLVTVGVLRKVSTGRRRLFLADEVIATVEGRESAS